jgi:phosphomannomutase
LVADENGDWLRGDILGLLCADAMSIEALAVPVSCNTAIESCKRFKSVTRTKIGSPYVIAEFDELSQKYSSISGFEANGGFILGSDVEFNNKCIKSLPTRDAVLPALMLLSLALEKKLTIYDLIDQLPKRFTYSDRIQNFKQGKSHSLLEQVKTSPQDFLNAIGLNNVNINSIDITDGLRITMSDLNVIHFRPSGNAPELRCYAESDKSFLAKLLVDNALNKISEM